MLASLPMTGRLDPTPDVAVAGAWIEARWGWRSRRPWRPTAVVRAAAMSCVATVSLANRRPTSILLVWNGRGVAEPQTRAGAPNAPRRGPKGNPPARGAPPGPQ